MGSVSINTGGVMSVKDKEKLYYTNLAYATCDTAAATADKVATIVGNNNWVLNVGSTVTVKYSNTNTASNCTLNVNGTGAKQIWYGQAAYTYNGPHICGNQNFYISYLYDGTYWVWTGCSYEWAYTHPSYTAETGVPTANQTPAFGGTFSVTQPVSDATGHITAMNSRTVKIPSSTATTSAAGLMSAVDKTKLNYTNLAYATCDTAAATAAKVATISGNSNWALTVGSVVTVKFSATNTASKCTLNVNNTGAKQIWYYSSVYTGSSSTVSGVANTFITFVYDGTYWVWMGHSLDNSPGYASANSAGTLSTGTQTIAGQKTFNGGVVIGNTPAESAVVARNIRAVASASVSSVTTSNLPVGSICFVY